MIIMLIALDLINNNFDTIIISLLKSKDKIIDKIQIFIIKRS